MSTESPLELSKIHLGDAREVLRSFPGESVQSCVTSPPFWALRDYGVEGQLGLEPSPKRYIVSMLRVFREVWRVLRDDGTLWIEIGDCYAGDGGGGGWFGGRGPARARVNHARQRNSGAKIKELVGIPFMLAFALRSRGWYWRQTCVWGKPNPRPEGAHDRPHTSHTYVLIFSKSESYFYDHEAVRQPTTGTAKPRGPRSDFVSQPDPAAGIRRRKGGARLRKRGAESVARYYKGIPADDRHLRSWDPAPIPVWEIHTAPGVDGHPASFPPELASRCILGGTRKGDVVLDPFCGSGTVPWVAKCLDREFVGIELHPKWHDQAVRRVAQGLLPLAEGE